MIRLKDISWATPMENIAFDDLLFSQAEKEGAGECLRFWESPRIFIVMGLTGKAEMEVAPQAFEDHIPVLKRSSGGGTVVQGPGCLNYTLVLSKEKHPQIQDLHRSYAWISGKVIKALPGIDAFFRPLSDLAVGPHEKKFSGNAQRRGKHYILHHGTILYDFDLSLISRYLNFPKEIPEYRRNRSHEDFVTNIPIDPKVFKQRLAQEFRSLSS